MFSLGNNKFDSPLSFRAADRNTVMVHFNPSPFSTTTLSSTQTPPTTQFGNFGLGFTYWSGFLSCSSPWELDWFLHYWLTSSCFALKPQTVTLDNNLCVGERAATHANSSHALPRRCVYVWLGWRFIEVSHCSSNESAPQTILSVGLSEERGELRASGRTRRENSSLVVIYLFGLEIHNLLYPKAQLI